MWFYNRVTWFFVGLLVLVPVITSLSDKELDICRGLGFIVNNDDLTTVKFKGNTNIINNYDLV